MSGGHHKRNGTHYHTVHTSRASVGRLSLYLRRLEALLEEGHGRVSSAALGEALAIPDTQVRKDLAPLDCHGQPGIGYATADLITAIRVRLGLDREWPAALAGVGNLGRALLRYHGFPRRGFRIVALFDSDPGKVGTAVDGLEIHPASRMTEVIRREGVELGILTVPSSSAQAVADGLIGAGVRGILNFAPGVIHTPAGVSVVNVDLTVQLEQLAFLVRLSAPERGPATTR
jgi:redox-sensing transcriptional repressor